MDSLARFTPTRIEGINLYFNDDGMSLVETARRNLKCIPFFLRQLGAPHARDGGI
jgi:hypothetical protein